jgi:hypothetical protein
MSSTFLIRSGRTCLKDRGHERFEQAVQHNANS